MSIAGIEDLVFRRRGAVVGTFVALTLVAAAFASRLVLDTAVASHLPARHEYIETFLEYQDELLGTDRVVVVLRNLRGDLFSVAGIRKLKQVHDVLAALPGIDRRTVTSLWTPGMTYLELDEEGLQTESVVGAEFTAETLDDEEVVRIRERVVGGGYEGRLVSRDHSAAMVVGSATGVDPETGEALGPIELAARLESGVRRRLSDDGSEIHLLGFTTMIGDIASGAKTAFAVLVPLSLLLTALSLRAWTGSWRLVGLALGCSAASLIWQLGFVALLGRALDPLTIAIPLLVFAVGAALAIPQAEIIDARLCAGDDRVAAAREAFRRLLLPGSAALLVAAASSLAVCLVPIEATRTLGLSATFGLTAKIATSLLLLPLLASFGQTREPARRGPTAAQRLAGRCAGAFAGLAQYAPALLTFAAFVLLAGLSVDRLEHRHFGDEHPGATELRPDSRYNRDAALVTSRFDFGLDLLTVIAETPAESCVDYEVMSHLDRFSWHMQNVDGVQSVMSAPLVAKYIAAVWNEGNPRWIALPRNRYALMQTTSSIPSALGVFNADCTLMPIQIFTEDHRDATVRRVVAAARGYREANPSERVRLRLASGGLAVQAATGETLAAAEGPMWAIVAAAAALLLSLAWRDWRGAIACWAAIAFAALVGAALLAVMRVGVMVSTLPTLVLGAGLGALPACLLWDALRRGLAGGADLPAAWRRSLVGTGGSVVGIGLTLALGCAPWAFSALTSQFEMGRLLTGLLLLQSLAALAVLPTVSTVLASPTARGEP